MGNDIWTVRSAGFGRFSITEMPTKVEKKSKQMDLKDTPEQMSLPINDLPYSALIGLSESCKEIIRVII